jgi:hypothetical protein
MIPLSQSVGLLLAAGLSALLGSLVLPRGFGADVTVEERGRDELVVTENPVEQGAAITDHAFKKPATLTVRVGFSNSSLVGQFDPLYVQTVYALMLALQAARIPFGIITGKRLYANMLITSLSTFTDEKWENAMMLVVDMKEIILVNTQTVSVPPSQNMQAPGINGATQSTGQQSLATATPNPAGIPYNPAGIP